MHARARASEGVKMCVSGREECAREKEEDTAIHCNTLQCTATHCNALSMKEGGKVCVCVC